MSKFAKQQYSGPQLEEYLKRKYTTYANIVETASRNTSLIKQVYISVIIGFTTMVFGGVLSTACITYAKYNKDFADYTLEFSNVFKYIIYAIIGLLAVFAIICTCLNAIWYKRQSNYRKLKEKLLFEITISANDKSSVTQSLEEYENEFRLLELDTKNDCDCRLFKSIFMESMVFIIPAIIVVILLLCLFILL